MTKCLHTHSDTETNYVNKVNLRGQSSRKYKYYMATKKRKQGIECN